MELSKQVVSLELAQKLKELGVKQESIFYWNAHWFHQNEWVIKIKEKAWWMESCDLSYSAFTVAELGEMLKGITSTWYDEPRWICAYVSKDEKKNICIEKGDTEADTRAKMLIYLIENKLISI